MIVMRILREGSGTAKDIWDFKKPNLILIGDSDCIRLNDFPFLLTEFAEIMY